MTEFEVLRYADVSTKHITEADDIVLHRLAASAGPTWVSAFRWGTEQYGWYISVEGVLDEENLAAFSAGFRYLINEAHQADVNYIRFDRDGTTYDNLETFDW
jgi:hypothetical protein